MEEDYYWDDPADEEVGGGVFKGKIPTAILVILALIGTTFFIRTTLASNIAISSTAVEFGQGAAATTACSGSSSLVITPTSAVSGNNFYLSTLKIENIPANCYSTYFNLATYASGQNSPNNLFGSVATLALYNNSGTFKTSIANSTSVNVTSASTTCAVGGSCNSALLTFVTPSLLSTSVKTITIQSGSNLATFACTFINTQCSFALSSPVFNWWAVTSSPDGSKLAAVVNQNLIYTSSDSGLTWTNRTNAPGGQWYAIDMSDDGTKLIAAVYGGGIYTSTDSGANWTLQSTPGNKNWFAVTISSDGTKMAVAPDGGDIFTSANSGSTWTDQTTLGSKAWRALTASSDGNKLAAGVYSGDIWTSADSGSTWTDRTSAGSRDWRVMTSSSDGSKIYAAVYSGDVYGSSDSGATWTNLTPTGPLHSQLYYSLSTSSDGTHIVANPYNANLFTSIDSGATWVTQSSAGSGLWRGGAISGDGSVIVGASSSGLFISRN